MYPNKKNKYFTPLRYGQPSIASVALQVMPETVSSENFHFWLSSLQLVAQAEQAISQESNQSIHLRLMSAGSSYVQAMNTLKVSHSIIYNMIQI